MAWFKRSLRISFLATVLAVALTLGLAVNLSAQMPSSLSSASVSSRLPNQWEFSAPTGPGKSIPDNRMGGGTRGPGDEESCLQSNASLTALVPASGIGETASPYPTVFWYMPQSSASEVEFVLRNTKEEEIFSAKYTLAKSAQRSATNVPGIMSLSLPAFANLSPLEVGQEYRWTVALVCNAIDRSSDITAEGGIRRVELNPTLAQSVQQATSLERVALFANARPKLWYETLGTLVELQRDYPNDADLKQAWNKLLNSVGLDTMFRKRISS